MSSLAVVIISVCFIAIAVVISCISKVNIGVPALGFGFLLGVVILGSSSSSLLSYFPTSVMYAIVAGSIFFGYALDNGTIQIFTQHIMHRCQNCGWILPFITFFCALIISGTGAGPTPALIVMAPIAISIATAAGYSYILAGMAVIFGAQAGSAFVWTSTSSLRIGYITAIWTETEASGFLNKLMATGPVMFLVMFIIAYLILKGWTAKPINTERPEKMNAVQKKTAIVILVGCLLVIIPILVEAICSNPVTYWLKNHYDTNTYLAIGILVAYFLKLGNTDEVIRKRVPWGMVFMLIGVNILIGVAVDYGLAEMLGSLIGENVPTWIIPGFLGLVGAVLSLFSGFTVVYPLLLPMLTTFEAMGANMIAMMTAVIFTTGVTAMSPFSMAGAMMISQIPDESVRQKTIPKQMVITLLMGLLVSIYCCTPLCNLFVF